jgi:hypothetical protein
MTSQKSKQRIFLILLIVVLSFGFVATKIFSLSAYGACRKAATSMKGYAVWQYINTINDKESPPLHYTTILFSDRHNGLSCPAVGIGPVWFVVTVSKTLLPCPDCAEGYYGVSP